MLFLLLRARPGISQPGLLVGWRACAVRTGHVVSLALAGRTVLLSSLVGWLRWLPFVGMGKLPVFSSGGDIGVARGLIAGAGVLGAVGLGASTDVLRAADVSAGLGSRAVEPRTLVGIAGAAAARAVVSRVVSAAQRILKLECIV